MKVRFFLGFILFLLAITSCNTNNKMKGTFIVNPEHPKVGEEITIKFNAVNTTLGIAQSVNAVIYSYNTDIEEANEIEMTKKGGLWTAKFTPHSNAKGVLLVFKNDEIIDNNNEKGYNIKLYKDGKVIPGALGGLAVLHKRYSRLIGFKGDAELAKLLLEEEFEKNPNIKPEYLEIYFLSLPRSIRDSVTKAELQSLEATNNLTENKIELLAKFFPMVGDSKKGEKYLNLLSKKFPQAEDLQLTAFNKFSTEKDINLQIKLLEKFNKKYPKSEKTQWMLVSIIKGLSKTNKFNEAQKLLKQYPKLVISNLYNSVTWAMFENKIEINTALSLAEKGVKLAREEIKNNRNKPKLYTVPQWQKSMQRSLGMILDTYANLLSVTNQKEKALKAYKEAIKTTNEEMLDVKEGYASLLVELGKNEEAKEVLQKYLDSGKSTDKMKSLYSQVFVELGGSSTDLKKFLSKSNKKENQKIIEKLEKEILNKPAPQFSLVDLNGKTVSLADFKGTTIIVDFWATWCSPCLQSFPAMKQAQTKLSQNDNVKFLFINTWERAENKKKNVQDFLKKTKYPFHILIDENNEVVSKFGVEGIPTKFIIDKNGNIRFKSVGFNGSANALVLELEKMVSMIK